ncbi:MAG TPA: HDOD domain-containing protein [Opitutaceae bacterium]|nr:HDOD domain-containing protein [Opitutaceae bacterium]
MTLPSPALACEDRPVPSPAAPPAREALLLAVNMLPASPQILARLDPLLLDLQSSVEDITNLLRRDAALTARILRIANSVMYNQGEPLASLEAALVRIGFIEVYRVTGFAVLAQVSNQQVALYDINGAQFRENSLLTALIMEALAEAAGIDPRSAYTAGLLRSTGKIALDRAMRSNGRYQEIEPFARGPLIEWETSTFGWNNCDAAALVLEAWRFPPEMIAAVRDHYLLAPGASPLAHLLNLAAGAAERCGHGLPGEYPYWDLTPERCAAVGIDEESVETAMRRALEVFGPVRTAVG